MKQYIAFEAKLFLKNRRNFFLFLGVAVFLIGLLFYIPYQNVNNIEEKTEVEAQSIRNAIAYVPLHEMDEETFKEEHGYYDHLLRESQAVANQEVALTMFEDLDQYVDAGIQVTNARIQAHEAGYGSLPEEFITPFSQSLKEQERYHYLQENNMQIEPNVENGANTLTLAITWFSAVSFFFLLFLSCDVLIADEEHKTIISAYPLNANQKVMGKLIIQTLCVLGILTALFTVGYFISSLIFGSGTLAYPEPLFWREQFTAIPTYLFIIGFFILFFIFVIHMILFSSVLNIIFKNKYLTIFMGGFLYIIGFLMSPHVPLLRFTPLNYLNPAGVLTGDLAVQFNQPTNDALMALIVLGVWSTIYGILLSLVFRQKNKVKRVYASGGNDV